MRNFFGRYTRQHFCGKCRNFFGKRLKRSLKHFGKNVAPVSEVLDPLVHQGNVLKHQERLIQLYKKDNSYQREGYYTKVLQPDFGLFWWPISPLGHQGGLSGATCSHCHQTEKGFLDCGSLCLDDLPSELRFLPRGHSSCFYKLLKRLLFGRAWAGSASE